MDARVFFFDRLDSCVALTVTNANLIPLWSGALTMPQLGNTFAYKKALLQKFFRESRR